MSPIKVGNLQDPNERERLIMAVAQHLCCETGCRVDGVGCKAQDFREAAMRDLADAARRAS
jgi:hypothetical protein